MIDRKKSGQKSGLSRRGFVAATAAGALSPLVSGRGVWAADSENVIRVGFVSPVTGNLGGFGVGDGYLTKQVRKALDKGLKVGDKTYKVVLLDRDSQSDPARAGQIAKALISSDKIDFMLVTSTPEVVNPVADACEAAGVPCLSTVMPWEAWYFGRGGKPGQPSPFKWTYHFAFGGAQFAGLYLSLWRQIPNNKRVGVMFPNDADGNAVRPLLTEAFKKADYTVIDAGPFEDGTSDYATQIALFKKEKVDLFVALGPSARLFRVVAPSCAAGFRKDREDCHPDEIRRQSDRNRGARRSRLQPYHHLALGPGSALQVAGSRNDQSATCGRLRGGVRQASDAAIGIQQRGFRRRLSGPANVRQPVGQGCRGQNDEQFEMRNDGRSDRLQHWSDAARHRCHAVVRHAVA